jgi:hypothetical protein
MKTDGRVNSSTVLVGIIAGLALLTLRRSSVSGLITFPVSEFILPEEVAPLYSTFQQADETEFVYAVWDYVGSSIPYEAIGSELYVRGDYCTCADCYLGLDAVTRKKGNCVSKSSLLASLLVNRIPGNRVALVIGEVYNTQGVSGGGHCWVEYQSPDGVWYVLESTVPPVGWIPVAMVSEQYIPNLILIDGSYQCNDHDICETVTKLTIGCSCQPTVRKISARFKPKGC